MKKIETVKLARHARSATLRSDSYNDDDNSVDIIWTTGADVLRCDPWSGDTYIERLLTGPENVRLDRLNAGAAFLDTHNSSELASVIGGVIPNSARMNGGLGLCKVKLSQSDRAADTVQDIRDGIINNVSVGYSVHAFTRTEATDGSPAIMVATDWEPVEISAVPVPADPGAQIRSATRSSSGVELNNCTITRADDSAHSNKEPILADENKNDKAVEDKKADKSVDKAAISKEKDEKHEAAEKAGIHKDDVVKVHNDKVIVTAKDTDVVDPGDAHGTKVTERDLKRMMSEAVSQERVRNNDIMTLTRRYGLESLGAEHCARGSSVQSVKDEILERLAERSAASPIHANVEVESLNKTAKKDERSAGKEWAEKYARKAN